MNRRSPLTVHCCPMLHLLLLLVLPIVVTALVSSSHLKPAIMSKCHDPGTLFFSANEDQHDVRNDEDEYEISVKPYQNRSLAWTLRYRQLNPYELARARVISFGHRSKEDWDEAVASGQLG